MLLLVYVTLYFKSSVFVHALHSLFPLDADWVHCRTYNNNEMYKKCSCTY